MIQNDLTLDAMATLLAESGEYRVLRRLAPRPTSVPPAGLATKTAVLIDVETTGLDHRSDEIIEIGMLKFDYCADGRIAGVGETFASFNEPTRPIPPHVTALTGIDDGMVAGRRIDGIEAFVEDAAVMIAHNAGFDRKFVERCWPVFESKAWACSATELDWRSLGFQGSALGYLLNGTGLFHQAHRAVDDCRALLEILAFELPGTGSTVLAALLERARRKTVRVWAEQSPYELKDALKKRGYRWSDGSDGGPRSWFVDVDETALQRELEFLQAEIYLRDVEPRLREMTAFERFSERS
jgi:DNA polymerase III subunit epsilon